MSDVTVMTRAEVQSWMNQGITDAMAKFNQGSQSQMSQDNQADAGTSALPALIDIYGVTIDGRPVKADLIDGKYHANQVSMKAPGFAGIIESGDDFRIPVLNLKLGPIASGLTGIFVGTVGFNLVDMIVAPTKADGSKNYMNLGANLLAAGVFATYAPKYIGKTAAYFAAGTIAVGLAMRWTPFQNWVMKVTDMLAGPLHGLHFGQGSNQHALAAGHQIHEIESSPAYAQNHMLSSGMSLANS